MFIFNPNTFQKMYTAGSGGGGGHAPTIEEEWVDFQNTLDRYELDLTADYALASSGASAAWQNAYSDIDDLDFDYENSSMGDPTSQNVGDDVWDWFDQNFEGFQSENFNTADFMEEYAFYLPEYDPSDMDTLTGRYDTQKANLTEGYDVWLAGETAVHEMATSQAQDNYDLQKARGKKSFEEQVDQVARLHDQALASAKSQSRSATSQLGKAGIARGASATPKQARLDSYSDSIALINQAEVKLRTEYNQGVEEMTAAFEDQQELASTQFENSVESQLTTLFNNLENMGLDFEAQALAVEEDYWLNLMDNLSTIVLTSNFQEEFGEEAGVTPGVQGD